MLFSQVPSMAAHSASVVQLCSYRAEILICMYLIIVDMNI